MSHLHRVRNVGLAVGAVLAFAAASTGNIKTLWENLKSIFNFEKPVWPKEVSVALIRADGMESLRCLVKEQYLKTDRGLTPIVTGECLARLEAGLQAATGNQAEESIGGASFFYLKNSGPEQIPNVKFLDDRGDATVVSNILPNEEKAVCFEVKGKAGSPSHGGKFKSVSLQKKFGDNWVTIDSTQFGMSEHGTRASKECPGVIQGYPR